MQHKVMARPQSESGAELRASSQAGGATASPRALIAALPAFLAPHCLISSPRRCPSLSQVRDITALNGLGKSTSIYPGQVLVLPETAVVVRPAFSGVRVGVPKARRRASLGGMDGTALATCVSPAAEERRAAGQPDSSAHGLWGSLGHKP